MAQVNATVLHLRYGVGYPMHEQLFLLLSACSELSAKHGCVYVSRDDGHSKIKQSLSLIISIITHSLKVCMCEKKKCYLHSCAAS